GHYPHVWSVSWYPWAFWAFGRFLRGQAPGALALPPILALSFLSGHPQEWYYLVVALSFGALGVALGRCALGQRRAGARALAVWLLLVSLSIGMGAVELVPDLSAQRWALRSRHAVPSHAFHYQVRALNLFQLLDPAALGGPADYFGGDNYWE